MVYGYVREIQFLLNKYSVIPEDIYDLCLLFTAIKAINFAWTTSKSSVLSYRNTPRKCGLIDMSNKRNTIINLIFQTIRTYPHNINSYCICQHGWIPRSGKHEMTIKVLKHSYTSHEIAIGIVTNPNVIIPDKDAWLFDAENAGYSYQFWFPSAAHSKPAYVYGYKYGVRNFKQYIDIFGEIQNGDRLKLSMDDRMNKSEIKMIIDCNEWELVFFYDNIQTGQTIKIEPDNQYYAAVAFGSLNAKYKPVFHG